MISKKYSFFENMQIQSIILISLKVYETQSHLHINKEVELERFLCEKIGIHIPKSMVCIFNIFFFFVLNAPQLKNFKFEIKAELFSALTAGSWSDLMAEIVDSNIFRTRCVSIEEEDSVFSDEDKLSDDEDSLVIYFKIPFLNYAGDQLFSIFIHPNSYPYRFIMLFCKLFVFRNFREVYHAYRNYIYI